MATVPSGVPRLSATRECPVVIAVDAGTYASSVAIAFRPRRGTEDVQNVRMWLCAPGTSGASDVFTQKNLTAMLLKGPAPGRSADSVAAYEVVKLGFDARARFAELTDTGSVAGHLYFENWKMRMYAADGLLRPESVRLTAAGTATTVPLPVVMALYLKAIKEDALVRLRSRLATDAASSGAASVRDEEIGWVVTLPAIWDDPAKGFMRKCAMDAGMITAADQDRLLLALEPEAAAIASLVTSDTPAVADVLRPGKRVMIVDAGGGTVDITTSEVVKDKPLQLREILPASGGDWGGTYVDKAMLTELQELLSDRWARVHAVATMTLLRDFEMAKRNFDPTIADVDYRVDIDSLLRATGLSPAEMTSLATAYSRRRGWGDADSVTATARGKLVLSKAFMKRVFDGPIDKTVAHIQRQLAAARDLRTPVTHILLVGGFAESPYMQQRIRACLDATCTVIVPPSPSQMVNRGAVYLGLYPQAFVTSRVARRTYALAVAEPWDAARHAGFDALRYRPAGRDCDHARDVLKSLVDIDGRVVSVRIYGLPEPIKSLPRPKVVQPSGAAAIPGAVTTPALCTIDIEVAPDDSVPREERIVNLYLYFGHTELVVQATAPRTGQTRSATIRYN